MGEGEGDGGGQEEEERGYGSCGLSVLHKGQGGRAKEAAQGISLFWSRHVCEEGGAPLLSSEEKRSIISLRGWADLERRLGWAKEREKRRRSNWLSAIFCI